MDELFSGSELADLIAKVDRGERLSFEDGVRLFKSNDLLAIGYMADKVRRRKSGERVYFAGNSALGQTDAKAAESDASLSRRTDSAMLYGHGESVEARVKHLVRLRELQDKSGDFLAFAPSAIDPGGTGPDATQVSKTTGFDDLKVLAAGRIMLDNFAHVRAAWFQLGVKLAQTSLSFGVDDLSEPVSGQFQAAGELGQAMTKHQLVELIRTAGRQPVERDSSYNIVTVF